MAERPVVIVGGGIAGLSVAKTLSASGIRCMIVERNPRLGGHVGNWACMATDQCQRCFGCVIEGLVRDVSASDSTEALTGWELTSVLSTEGDRKLVRLNEIETGAEVRVHASALVLATGFEPYDPAGKLLLGHGRLEGVYTLAEVDDVLRRDTLSRFTGVNDELKVAFFQCVGSRDSDAGANYCSQYCCKAALRMALKLIHEAQGVAVTVFYIDLQVAGKYANELMRRAERNSVRLRQGVPGEIVQSSENTLEVIVEHEGRNVKERFDRIILSIGQRPPKDMSSLAGRLGLPLNSFGYPEPIHVTDNSRTIVPGIYIAGTCSGPKDIERTLEHAGQTSAAIIADLQRGAPL
jgi:heterodisulfide reductase subunit A2